MTDARISFVIPVLNEQDTIAPLLASLNQRFPNSECIVVDGGSSDQTRSRAEQRCHQLVASDPGRARQMNKAAEYANGEYLFFLHADTAPQFTSSDIAPYLTRHPEWGFFPVRLNGASWAFRIIEYCMNSRSRTTRVATGDQLIYVRRDVFEHIGGYADVVLMEDVECSKRLRKLSRPLIPELSVETSARRWLSNGIVRTVFLMWVLRLAYFLGVSPARLSSYYRGH